MPSPKIVSSIRFKLPVQTVHVWKLSLDAGMLGRSADMTSLLSPDEIARASGISNKVDRSRFVAGRASLRWLAARYIGRSPSSLLFKYGRNGKPFLRGSRLPFCLHFNLSHSGDLVLLAFARSEVGVDIEKCKKGLSCKAIARRFFSDPEVTEIDGMTGLRARDAFYRCWTRKEALVKANGGGMFRDMKRIVVPAGPRDGKCAVKIGAKGRSASTTWFVSDLRVARGYKAAVAVRGTGIRVVSRRVPPLSVGATG